jgi:hypothetical protein
MNAYQQFVQSLKGIPSMSATQQQLDLLNATVDQFVQEGKAFSGYDVTLTTRERERIELRHIWVRDDIHRLPAINNALSMKGYERTLCDLWKCEGCGHNFVVEEGVDEDVIACPKCDSNLRDSTDEEEDEILVKKGQIIIYHLSGYDLSKVELRGTPTPNGPARIAGRDSVATPATDVIIGQLKQAAPTPAAGASSLVKELDYRQRLEIPADVVHQSLQLEPLADVFILPDPHAVKIQITKDKSQAPEGAVVCTQKVERNGSILLASRILNMAGLHNSKFVIKTVGTGIVEVIGV